MAMLTVCNNLLCKNKDNPCQAGCIQNGNAEICPPNINNCEFKPCPVVEPTPIPIYHCKGGNK